MTEHLLWPLLLVGGFVCAVGGFGWAALFGMDPEGRGGSEIGIGLAVCLTGIVMMASSVVIGLWQHFHP